MWGQRSCEKWVSSQSKKTRGFGRVWFNLRCPISQTCGLKAWSSGAREEEPSPSPPSPFAFCTCSVSDDSHRVRSNAWGCMVQLQNLVMGEIRRCRWARDVLLVDKAELLAVSRGWKPGRVPMATISKTHSMVESVCNWVAQHKVVVAAGASLLGLGAAYLLSSTKYVVCCLFMVVCMFGGAVVLLLFCLCVGYCTPAPRFDLTHAVCFTDPPPPPPPPTDTQVCTRM